MYFRKIVFTCFSIVLISTLAFGQTPSKIIWTSDTDLLPQNSVKSIVPDKYGYLWLTTENGLVRFDGQHYRTYNGQNLETASNRMLYIQGKSNTDSLYVSTEFDKDFLLIHKRGVQEMDTTKNKAFEWYKSTNKNFYNAFGIYPTKIRLSAYYYKILLPSKDFYKVKKDGFQYFTKNNQLRTAFTYKDPNTTRVFTLGEKLIYIIDPTRYLIIDKGKMTRHQFETAIDPDFQIIWNKPCEQVYIKSKEKLFQLHWNKSQLTTTFLLEDASLRYLQINSVFNDVSKKTLFLGSPTSGLGIYKVTNFNTLTVLDDHLSQIFYAIAPLNEKQIITSSGFIMDAKNVVKDYAFKTAEKRGMVMDKESNLWIQSQQQLYYYQKNKGYKNPSIWNFKQPITALYLDTSGKIWISLTENFESKNKLLFFRPSAKPVFRNYLTSKNTINYIVNRLNGKLLLATTAGLLELDEAKRKLRMIPGTSTLNIRSVSQTETDELWISTYSAGFYLHSNNQTKGFPLDKNGYLATTHYLKEDANGYMWIPTNKGLFQVTKKSLLAYFHKKSSTVYYHYYNKESGFLTNEFNGGASPFAAALGTRFFLPSMNGVVTFDTQKIQPLEPKNPIYIDEIRANNKNIPVQDFIQLPNDYQRVTFTFSSPYFGNAFNANYEVKLDGPTNLAWSPLASDQEFSFTKLTPGDYTLTVRKLSGFNATYIYKKIRIEIAPLIYQTTWFAIAIIAGLGILLFCGTKVYLNSIRARNRFLVEKIKEKTEDLQDTIRTLRTAREQMKTQAEKNNKLIQMISHDIKSPLRFMSMASKYMYDEFDPTNPDLKDNILSIHSSSSQIYNFLDNILSYTKVNSADGELANEQFILRTEIATKINFFTSIAGAQKTELVNSIPRSLKLNTNKSLFAIIIHNLLDNALKNSAMGTIEFSSEVTPDFVVLKISDQGVGMSEETMVYYQSVFDNFDLYKNKSNKKLGLHLVAELMLILNGKVTLKSTAGLGTTIKLEFSNYTVKESS